MFSKMKISTSTKDFYREMPNGYEESIRKGAGRPVDVRLARTGTEWRYESCEVL